MFLSVNNVLYPIHAIIVPNLVLPKEKSHPVGKGQRRKGRPRMEKSFSFCKTGKRDPDRVVVVQARDSSTGEVVFHFAK